MTRTVIDVLISWGPMILLIAVWIYFIRRSGAMNQRAYMDAANEHMKQHLSELKQMNEKLGQIATLLERNRKDG